MENGRFINTIVKLQNFPRWDEFPSKFEDNVSSHSYRVAMYTLIATLLENKKFQNNINQEKVICRAVFHDLNETKLGPFKYATKKDPELKDLIREFEKEASQEIVGFLSESLQTTFYDYVVNAEDSTLEGRLVDEMDSFDAFMFCHREMLFSSGVHPKMMTDMFSFFLEEFGMDKTKDYEESLHRLQEKIKETKNSYHSKAMHFENTYHTLLERLKNSEFESVRWLVAQVEEQTDMYQFLLSVLNMDTIRRWKGKFNAIHDDDAIHGMRSTGMIVFNCYLEKIKYNVDIDVFRCAAKMLGHDLVEEVTGDVLGPVKHSTPERKKKFEQYEKIISHKMIRWLPEELQENFLDYMVNAKSSDYEGHMVKVADKLDALVKANMERKTNSMEYERSYRKQLKLIQANYDNPSTVFFLAYILHDMDYLFYDDI